MEGQIDQAQRNKTINQSSFEKSKVRWSPIEWIDDCAMKSALLFPWQEMAKWLKQHFAWKYFNVLVIVGCALHIGNFVSDHKDRIVILAIDLVS